LLAYATSEKAVKRIFEVKKRDEKKPLQVFVKDIEMAKKYAQIDSDMEGFLREIWPGKITVALPVNINSDLAKSVYAENKTVALRIPNCKIILEILNKLGRPLIGTSANVAGMPSTVKIDVVFKQFEDRDMRPDLVLSAGNLPENNPSTIIDFSNDKPKIIRKGK
jgi:L-threonylcarbamoyladenylate synthase